MASGLVALWPYGHKLYKANELGNLLAVCTVSIQESWTGVEHSVGCFDITNESLLSYQAYAVIYYGPA